LIILAGIPPIITFAGNLPVSTAPVATIELSPISVFLRIVTLLPI